MTLAMLVACASALAGPIAEAAAQGRWAYTGFLNYPRQAHTATLLPSGHLLVAGGFGQSSAELYDPATGRWTATAALGTARDRHTATLLLSGHVLVAGGENANGSAELYDPATGSWKQTGSLRAARSGHTATLLPSGQVLITGGTDAHGVALASAELYVAGDWIQTGALHIARNGHTATLLPSGQVLVAGGTGASGILGSGELYDPVAGSWKQIGPLNVARKDHTATLLPSGQVLIAGGRDVHGASLDSAELYDPTSDGRSAATAKLDTARDSHTATLLPSGQVLVVGGIDVGYSAELYDPSTGAWTALSDALGLIPGGHGPQHTATLLPSGRVLIAGGLNFSDLGDGDPRLAVLYDPAIGRWTTGLLGTARSSHTATLLPSGQVLLAGGTGAQGLSLDSAELYDATIGRGTATGSLATARSNHTATLLPSGRVLVAGGTGGILGSAELYDPATKRWTATGALGTSRANHTATLLPSGQVLVAGGADGRTARITSAELYDPTTARWTPTKGTLGTGRALHTATLLPSGQVLVVGGTGDVPSAAELYDSATEQWTSTGDDHAARTAPTATLLPSGHVLASGALHDEDDEDFISTATLYDPTTGQWTAIEPLGTRRSSHTATLLLSGRVLIAGGVDRRGILSSAQLYDPSDVCRPSSTTNCETVPPSDPSAGLWAATASLGTGRSHHTATLLPSGQVLIAGGSNGTSALASTEIYDPGLGFQEAQRPGISSVTTATIGSELGLEGSFFLGLSEASGGSTPQSATNYPLVQLRRLDNEQTRFLLPDPAESWADNTFTSLPLPAFPPGPALVTVFTNGIPSVAASIVVHAKSLGTAVPQSPTLDPVQVGPLPVTLGHTVEVTTTVRAGATAVPSLTVRFYDGPPGEGGQVFADQAVGPLDAHGVQEVHARFRPSRCGSYQLVVVAGEGPPFEVQRAAPDLPVHCPPRR